ncbi:hypothetical protein PATSB16_18660 [Pandoraea thiooxydans]|nr:hypothetical protein PATSB16_18660 [Pandoraea thiooxydans]
MIFVFFIAILSTVRRRCLASANIADIIAASACLSLRPYRVRLCQETPFLGGWCPLQHPICRAEFFDGGRVRFLGSEFFRTRQNE